ncbi:hypothetical protein BVG19_g5025 [[Candida] boidinii]|nr:hypothetical protein BVG19_g5025 [[Candida] boidinii]OWB53497.1 hypothetical protein B5S27_g5097 [[Candida] boidinii]OWB65944.1 hypothetical protein B5S30_g1278 [[Candida] boidinii]
MPMLYKPRADGYEIKHPVLDCPGGNTFVGDIFTSAADPGKEITSGFYRQEDGEALEYTYDYDEMKIILEVVGEYIISDETGLSVSVKPGDVFYFKKGSTVTFKNTGGYGYAFFVGARPADTA